MIERIIYKWLRVPYSLHAGVRRPAVKPVATIVFLHGIGNSGEAWNATVQKVPNNVRTVSIDLLGFGKSPCPSWIVYDTKTQARSVMKTLLFLRIRGPIIIVGHSLGSLVAVEIAKRYPALAKALILCSPPFYHLSASQKRSLPQIDTMLRSMYVSAENNPEMFLKIATIAMRYKLVNPTFSVSEKTIGPYMNTLRASILNQSSLDDIQKLHLPVRLLYGTLDPIVIGSHLRRLAKQQKNITLSTVVGYHEVKARMSAVIIRELKLLLAGEI